MKKECIKCHDNKDLTDFFKTSHTKGGFDNSCKKCVMMRHRLYQQSEKGKIVHRKASTKWSAKKRKESPQFKLTLQLRNRVKNAIKTGHRSGSAVKDLGCTVKECIEHIESLFTSGMNWENHGRGKNKWHIDHITPLSSFDLTDREQFLRACHFTNLQPLWQTDNLKKSNRV